MQPLRFHRLRLRHVQLVVIITALCSANAFAATFLVHKTEPGAFRSVRAAYNAVPLDGQRHTIQVQAELWLEAPGPFSSGRLVNFESLSGTAIITPNTAVNDHFVNRIALNPMGARAGGFNYAATKEPGEPNHYGEGGKSLWWSWTAPGSGGVVISTAGSDFRTELAVYTGSAVASLTRVDSIATFLFMGVTYPAQVGFEVQAGVTYQLAVDGYLGSTGAVALSLTYYPPPSNDSFASRLPLTGAQVSVPGHNFAATAEPSEPIPPCETRASKSVWWSWTAPFSGGTRVCASRGDYTTMAYTGSSLASLVPVSAGESGCATFNAQSGTEYQIATYTSSPFESISLYVDLVPEFFPPNDHFMNRIAITNIDYPIRGTNVGASSERDEPRHSTYLDFGKSVWWSWTAPTNGIVTLDTTGTEFEPFLAVYRGFRVCDLNENRVVDNTTVPNGEPFRPSPTVSFLANAGTIYQIAVRSQGSGEREGAITLSVSIHPPPVNDHFPARTVIYGETATLIGNNFGASKEPGERSHAGSSGGSSVWYSWTASYSGRVSLDTHGTQFDTLLAVYTGISPSGLAPVASDGTGLHDGSLNSEVSFNATAGVTYQIAVDGPWRESQPFPMSGPFLLSLRQERITHPPLAITAIADLGSVTNAANLTKIFTNQLTIANSATGPSGPLRVRLVATPGFSFVETNGPPTTVPNDIPEVAIFALPAPGFLAAAANRNLIVSTACPPPQITGSAGFGWGIVAVLEEEFGGQWLVQDSRYLTQGVWPTVQGFEGPGGGVIMLSPGVNGVQWVSSLLSNVVVNGPATIPERSAVQLTGTATFLQGDLLTQIVFSNTAWASSRFSISTNGILRTGTVISDEVITVTNRFSFKGRTNSVARPFTVVNMPPRLDARLTTNRDSVLLELNGDPDRPYEIEWTPALASLIAWTNVATNTTSTNGTWQFVDPVTPSTRQRFYRARELP